MEYSRFCPTTLPKETHPHLANVSMCWETDKYQILFDEIKGFKHLRIRRLDNKPIHSYMDLQEIKNDLWGSDVIAVEIYPNQSDFKDGSNTYHLWTWDALAAPNLSTLYKYS